MTLLITFVLLALGVSFICSVMEAVLLSVTPAYVRAAEQEGRVYGRRLAALKEDVDRPLAAILSLNTVAHTVGATGAGAQAVEVFGEAWLGAASAILTLLILVVSEIIPKTIGAVYWRGLTGPVVYLLRPTMLAMWPLVQVSRVLTKWLSRGKKEAPVSREEIGVMADLGHEHGALGAGESRILKSLLHFRTVMARDVMTPRTVVMTMPASMTVAAMIDAHPELRFSRLPLTGASGDDVTTYVLKDEVLLRAARGDGDRQLSELARPILVLASDLRLPRVLERLLEQGEHIALVTDEYGGNRGIVTLEDVIETLLGLEIVDEADSVEDMQALARERWRKRARRLGLEPPPAESEDESADGARDGRADVPD